MAAVVGAALIGLVVGAVLQIVVIRVALWPVVDELRRLHDLISGAGRER